jgi:hypothetical protein
MKNPPKEVYFLASNLKNRLYMTKGTARLGYNSVRGYWGTDAKVWAMDMGEWIDVTEEFSK